MPEFKIGERWVGTSHPVFFIAEIGANHGGELARAFKLIELAKDSEADCAKFQHYTADTLASKRGFELLGNKLAHYTENPYDIFKKYEVPWEWTPLLKEHCDKVGIEFMSTPYSLEAVDHLNPYVSAFKIGSGDITYLELIKKAALTGKPLLLATGASTTEDILRVLDMLDELEVDPDLFCAMQCNTNYEDKAGDNSCVNLKFIQDTNDVVLGFSSHTTSHNDVLGAIARGAKVIEKHFTDGESDSPDNPFALRPDEFETMVNDSRELESMLGNGIKKIEENEKETVVLQRRCLRAATDLAVGTVLTPETVTVLRPAPEGSLPPYVDIIGKKLCVGVAAGVEFNWQLFTED